MTAMPEPPQWDRLSRTGSGFTIWEETSGNGAKMSIALEQALGCCAARRGATLIAALCSRRTATTFYPAFATITSGFVVWLGRPLPSVGAQIFLVLFFGPFTLYFFEAKPRSRKKFSYLEDRVLIHPPVMRPISSIFEMTKASWLRLIHFFSETMRQKTRNFSS